MTKTRKQVAHFRLQNFLVLLPLLLLLTGKSCDARSFSPRKTPVLHAIRAGATDSFGFTRRPAKPNSSPFSSSTQNAFQSDSKDEFKFDEQTPTKEILNSFLTRDSRNTFIGAKTKAFLSRPYFVFIAVECPLERQEDCCILCIFFNVYNSKLSFLHTRHQLSYSSSVRYSGRPIIRHSTKCCSFWNATSTQKFHV